MRIAIGQINTTVGDIESNFEKIKEFSNKAIKKNCDLVVFPELALTGYPPEDLLTNSEFLIKQKEVFLNLKYVFREIVGIVGFVNVENGTIYNSAGVVYKDEIFIYNKTRLPNYGVFDEERYFAKGNKGLVLLLGSTKVGITICEDIWYPGGIVTDEVIKGKSEIIINISASPYNIGKTREREEMLKIRAKDHIVFLVYANLVGGQDELVFDGNSLVISPEGKVIAQGKPFEEELVVVDIEVEEVFRKRLLDQRYKFLLQTYSPTYEIIEREIELSTKEKNEKITSDNVLALEEEEEIIEALKTSIRDYIRKNNFSKVVIGISGGIDSALVAYICTEALGKENVIGVSMPSRFSSEGTKSDAKKLCENLGIKFLEIPIEKIFTTYLEELKTIFEGTKWDITEENLQARIRGNILMALSNKFGWIVVSTGNKSELSMGYSTLYGDMVGGFALIKDIYKTTVYKLVNYINKKHNLEIIPRSIIERPPSAELRENQKD
ncbi:MAG: NAD+ synthase, partial [Brevinematia bacterium]